MIRAKKVEMSFKKSVGPMESQTTQMLHFLPHDIKPIILQKDLHPNYYIPPIAKFNHKTTTGETFKGEPGSLSKSCKPDHANLDRTGEFDFNTNYKETYKNHGLTMCEAKAYLIASARSKSTFEMGHDKINNLGLEERAFSSSNRMVSTSLTNTNQSQV